MNTTNDFSSYKDNFVVVHQGDQTPEISVVMPIYNCKEFIVEAVTSALAQQDVVIEIIISDDASTDDTFALAYATVVDYINKFGLKHTVIMRVGSIRLVRDHLHLLAKQASCDLVCQAHGDDISHPNRCSLLVKVFSNKDKKASMVFVSAVVIDSQGKVVWTPDNLSLSNIPIVPVEYNKIINARDEILIGSNMAWRKSAFDNFPQLTTAYCSYGHDRVMTFRSFLVGGCYLIDAPLLKRRLHDNNLHKELFSPNSKATTSFNIQLIRLSLFSTMKKDLIFLKENNLIDEARVNQHFKNVNDAIIHLASLLIIATNTLVADGYVNKWVK
jgi:glycosyltransferase involved in cell wall biosynthesis